MNAPYSAISSNHLPERKRAYRVVFSVMALVILGSSLMMSGCRSARPAIDRQNAIVNRLMQQYDRWEGTPYRLGGITKSGVDCSAFVQQVMKAAFNVDLPRTTRQQINFGSGVNPRRMKTGDIVFFQTGRNTLHVGIMLNDGNFMHAGVSTGVTIAHLSENYWRQRFIRARRVL
jgi:cell wall-associated NlpC family hydrolase